MSNHPWSFPVLASRFAASLLSSVEIISIFLRCLPVGCQFAIGFSSQSAGKLAASSTVSCLRAATPPDPPRYLSFHLGQHLVRCPSILHLTVLDDSFDTVDEVSSTSCHLRDRSVWRAFSNEKVSWDEVRNTLNLEHRRHGLLHYWRHLLLAAISSQVELYVIILHQKNSSFDGGALTGRPPESTPVFLYIARIFCP